jgi:hypothetical protein
VSRQHEIHFDQSDTSQFWSFKRGTVDVIVNISSRYRLLPLTFVLRKAGGLLPQPALVLLAPVAVRISASDVVAECRRHRRESLRKIEPPPSEAAADGIRLPRRLSSGYHLSLADRGLSTSTFAAGA